MALVRQPKPAGFRLKSRYDTFAKLFRLLSMGSRVILRTSCINSINKLRGATIFSLKII